MSAPNQYLNNKRYNINDPDLAPEDTIDDYVMNENYSLKNEVNELKLKLESGNKYFLDQYKAALDNGIRVKYIELKQKYVTKQEELIEATKKIEQLQKESDQKTQLLDIESECANALIRNTRTALEAEIRKNNRLFLELDTHKQTIKGLKQQANSKYSIKPISEDEEEEQLGDNYHKSVDYIPIEIKKGNLTFTAITNDLITERNPEKCQICCKSRIPFRKCCNVSYCLKCYLCAEGMVLRDVDFQLSCEICKVELK